MRGWLLFSSTSAACQHVISFLYTHIHTWREEAVRVCILKAIMHMCWRVAKVKLARLATVVELEVRVMSVRSTLV